MMAKIVKGSDFKGAVDYIIDKKKDTQIVASEGLFMENLETIAMSFNAQSRMNDKVTKPVGHIALSFSKEDELRLTNRIMAGIALEYMERMGIKNTQFFIAQHFDKEHPHVHIAFNRIDNNGNTISANWQNIWNDARQPVLRSRRLRKMSVPGSWVIRAIYMFRFRKMAMITSYTIPIFQNGMVARWIWTAP